MAKNLKVTIDSEEFRNSFRPHMPPNRESMEETPKEQKEVSKEEPRPPQNIVSTKNSTSLMEEYQERYIRRSENPARSQDDIHPKGSIMRPSCALFQSWNEMICPCRDT